MLYKERNTQEAAAINASEKTLRNANPNVGSDIAARQRCFRRYRQLHDGRRQRSVLAANITPAVRFKFDEPTKFATATTTKR